MIKVQKKAPSLTRRRVRKRAPEIKSETKGRSEIKDEDTKSDTKTRSEISSEIKSETKGRSEIKDEDKIFILEDGLKFKHYLNTKTFEVSRESKVYLKMSPNTKTDTQVIDQTYYYSRDLTCVEARDIYNFVHQYFAEKHLALPTPFESATYIAKEERKTIWWDPKTNLLISRDNLGDQSITIIGYVRFNNSGCIQVFNPTNMSQDLRKMVNEKNIHVDYHVSLNYNTEEYRNILRSKYLNFPRGI